MGWREVDSNPCVVLLLDVETADGVCFRGVADETLAITELSRLTPGQMLPVRDRPAAMDRYLALAKEADPVQVRELAELIAVHEGA